MAGRKLRWTSKADSDVVDIMDFWTENNGNTTYSKKLNTLFNEMAERLRTQPKLGKNLIVKNNLRVTFISDYLMLYTVLDVEFSILRIWDSRRNPDDFKKIIDLF